MRSVRIPHEPLYPATTEVKVPPGAAACPASLRPQHATVWSVRSAQAWKYPALIWVNVPGGDARNDGSTSHTGAKPG